MFLFANCKQRKSLSIPMIVPILSGFVCTVGASGVGGAGGTLSSEWSGFFGGGFWVAGESCGRGFLARNGGEMFGWGLGQNGARWEARAVGMAHMPRGLERAASRWESRGETERMRPEPVGVPASGRGGLRG